MKNFILGMLISLVSVFNSYAETVNDTLTALKLKEVTVNSCNFNEDNISVTVSTKELKTLTIVISKHKIKFFIFYFY